MSDFVNIELPERLELAHVPILIKRLQPLLHAEQRDVCARPHIDMRYLRFITPTALAALAATMLDLSRRTTFDRVDITRPQDENVHNYLARMEFYGTLTYPADFPWTRRNSEGRFREIVEVASEDMSASISTDLVSILQAQIRSQTGECMTGSTVHAIQYALAEMIDNVFHHAASPVNAIVCAQAYPTRRCVEFAIVDTGCGIRRSLNSNPSLRGSFRSPREALQLAVQSKITSRPNFNSGEGLFFTTEMVKEYAGDMCLYSEGGLLNVTEGLVRLQDVVTWPGTIVGLRFRLDQPIDIEALMNRYAPPAEDYRLIFDSSDAEIPF